MVAGAEPDYNHWFRSIRREKTANLQISISHEAGGVPELYRSGRIEMVTCFPNLHDRRD